MQRGGRSTFWVLNQNLLNQFTRAFDANLARLKCMTILVCSMLRHRTVNLTILATENQTGAKNESCYRRFQDFFLKFALPLDRVGAFILGKIPKPEEGWTLSMDRTNWKHGKKHINILTIGVVVNRIAIPVAWLVLPQKTKRGNSNTGQRIKVTRRLFKFMPTEDVRVLTMDREFGGAKWLKWLEENGIGYVVRVKSNTLVDGRHASDHGRMTRKTRGRMHQVWGLSVYFSHKYIRAKDRRDTHVYVISNRFTGDEALELYRLRWGIEQLFSHLKKRGFNLEDTHMIKGFKLEKLFALVSLAFLISFAWGCNLRAGGGCTKATLRKSIFRHGLEDILRLLSNPNAEPDRSQGFCRWLEQQKFDPIFLV